MNGTTNVSGGPSSAPGVIWRTPSFLARSSIISLKACIIISSAFFAPEHNPKQTSRKRTRKAIPA
jgi:hypothetical protein